MLFFRPLLALFVIETRLLPVLVPFPPEFKMLGRFPAALLTNLQAHGIPRSFTEPELAEMTPCRVAKTASRSVLGVMNEFRYLADMDIKLAGVTDPLSLSVRRAMTQRGPLYKRQVSPDRELAALVDASG